MIGPLRNVVTRAIARPVNVIRTDEPGVVVVLAEPPEYLVDETVLQPVLLNVTALLVCWTRRANTVGEYAQTDTLPSKSTARTRNRYVCQLVRFTL